MSIVSCKEEDCQRKVQARGMCSTHYSYWQRSNAKHELTCAICGESFVHNRKGKATCSPACHQTLTLSTDGVQRRIAASRKTDAIVRYLRPKVWLGSTLQPRNGSPLVAGQCAYCPTYFTGAPGSRYCSERCHTNASWKRRYDRRGEFKVTDKLRLAIYERDAYTCQLCSESVDATLHYQDRMSATLDHIIPQSWMLIPDHSEGNLRLAHRGCNSTRGDRVSAA